MPTFTAGVASTFDLATTLPAGVAKGGTFGVSPTGAALPTGVTLSPGGLLSVAATVGERTILGVIFEYTEPAV